MIGPILPRHFLAIEGIGLLLKLAVLLATWYIHVGMIHFPLSRSNASPCFPVAIVRATAGRVRNPKPGMRVSPARAHARGPLVVMS